MTPSLESVLFASATTSFNVNRLSREVDPEERLFRNHTLNGCVIFKFPNFDPARMDLLDVPGVELMSGRDGGNRLAVRTGIFAPKSSDEPQLGGFGIFLDDPALEELMARYVGLNIKEESDKQDMSLLGLLQRMPSLDPFLLRETFIDKNRDVHPAYVEITEPEVFEVRRIIGEKVKPIVAKAMGVTNLDGDELKTRKFVDAIWDPSLGEAQTFIAALGLKPEQAPRIFEAWKGVSYYYNEYQQQQNGVARFVDWLQSDMAVPIDYRQLQQGTREQIDMFRNKVFDQTNRVSENVRSIFQMYDDSYRYFIAENSPTKFREFLMKAGQYYWKVGACNGVLAQMATTWGRYYQDGVGRRLTYEETERLYKVCTAILDSHDRDEGGAI